MGTGRIHTKRSRDPACPLSYFPGTGRAKQLGTLRLACAVFLFFCSIGPVSLRPFAAQEPQYLTGQFLVATPEMGDPRFVETVIYMVEHDETGAMGLVINRPLLKGPISDLVKGLGIEDKTAKGEIVLHYGGPVETQKAFVLHSNDYAGKGTKRLGGGISVTGDVEIVRDIAQGKGPGRSIFAIGYAGWAPGQLEAEIKANGWFVIPADEKLIFDGDPATKWDRTMARRKIKT